MAEPSAPALPRGLLAAVCTVHAAVFGAAAASAPSARLSWFALSAALISALHACVVLLAALRKERALRGALALLALASLLWLLAVSWVVASSSLYLSALYQGIGRAVSVALLCVWGIIVLFTLPVAAWALALARPRWLGRRTVAVGGVLLCVAAAGSALSAGGAARAEPLAAARAPELGRSLAQIAMAHVPVQRDLSLLTLAPIACEQPVDGSRLTLWVAALDPLRAPFMRCLQAANPAELERALTRLLAEEVHVESPLALELVRAVQPIPRVHPLLDAFALRPAADGVCGVRRCFASWQLVARDAFTRYRPLQAVRDASFGVALDELRGALGEGNVSLSRIESELWVVSQGTTTKLERLRATDASRTPARLAEAVRLAALHILTAQQPDGSFRYLLDPYSGREEHRAGNLPRQAGTVYALCELAPPALALPAVERALGRLAQSEQTRGALSALSDSLETADLGASALPLVALATCRAHLGDRHDVLIGRLARFLLAMQRADGSFHPEMALATATPQGAHEALYAAGQAVLGLVLVEQLARTRPSPVFPSAEELGGAVQRAMDHYAHDYWPAALRSLFYLEENWHCLAARAALRSHRHDGYERFCLDYVRFKRRLILESATSVPAPFVGGYGLGPLFPPHSTPTAGYGEALAAAIAVARARGEPLHELREVMRHVLGFLLRQQWQGASAFASARVAVGAFSESVASPAVRIDYVQHAMAALGHGARSLAE